MRELLSMTCILALASLAAAEAKVTKLVEGSNPDETLQSKGPANNVITTAKDLQALWETWKIEAKLPEIDFTKEIVLVSTTRGSRLSLNARLGADGDLMIQALTTRDLRPGFRFVLGSFPREGVKTIAGKPIP